MRALTRTNAAEKAIAGQTPVKRNRFEAGDPDGGGAERTGGGAVVSVGDRQVGLPRTNAAVVSRAESAVWIYLR